MCDPGQINSLTARRLSFPPTNNGESTTNTFFATPQRGGGAYDGLYFAVSHRNKDSENQIIRGEYTVREAEFGVSGSYRDFKGKSC